jgi:hypothetical protein
MSTQVTHDNPGKFRQAISQQCGQILNALLNGLKPNLEGIVHSGCQSNASRNIALPIFETSGIIPYFKLIFIDPGGGMQIDKRRL